MILSAQSVSHGGQGFTANHGIAGQTCKRQSDPICNVVPYQTTIYKKFETILPQKT